MSRVAIITLNGYFNYGNRLQNLALQLFLEKQGFNVETIRFERDKKTVKQKFKSQLSVFKNNLLNRKDYQSHLTREKIFKEFSQLYINETNEVFDINSDLSLLNEQYDYFVIGSDQVWNPQMNRASGAFFADFAEKEKKISYAASFGVSEIEPMFQNNYANYLAELKDISVREKAGQDIVAQLTGRDSEVLVDPTMLVDANTWRKIAKKNNQMSEPYLLTYFLGGLPEQYKIEIEKYASQNNLKIINLGDISNKDTYETGPAEFLAYIDNCEVFCTDSFHGCVFSILLDKPFIAYKRVGGESMYSRIETLLETFGLLSRENEKVNQDNLFETDYDTAHKKLDEENIRSVNFIKRNLTV